MNLSDVRRWISPPTVTRPGFNVVCMFQDTQNCRMGSTITTDRSLLLTLPASRDFPSVELVIMVAQNVADCGKSGMNWLEDLKTKAVLHIQVVRLLPRVFSHTTAQVDRWSPLHVVRLASCTFSVSETLSLDLVSIDARSADSGMASAWK